MTGADVATFAAALFAIVNPLIRIGPFLEMTAGRSPMVRRQFIFTAVSVQLIGYLAAAWFGRELLELLGVSIPALKAAGGAVIVALAFPMVLGGAENNGSNEQREIERVADDRSWRTVAVVPFGVPLLVGPGQISLIVATTAVFDTTQAAVSVTIVCAVAVIGMAIVLLLAERIERVIGPTGISIVTRLFGFVLLAIGFSIVTSGLVELMPGLA